MDEPLFADGLSEDFRCVPRLAAGFVLPSMVFIVAVTTRPAQAVESEGAV